MKIKKPKIKYYFINSSDGRLCLNLKFIYAGIKYNINVVHYYGDAYFVSVNARNKFYLISNKKYNKKFEKQTLYCFRFSEVQNFFIKYIGRDYTQYFPKEFFSEVVSRKYLKNSFEN